MSPMLKKLSPRLLAAFFCLACPLSMLSAQVPKDYFWRIHFGTGLGSFVDEPKDETQDKLEFEGLAGFFGLKLGYMYSPKTSIDLGFSSIRDNNPNIKRANAEIEDILGAYGAAALGLGISHFFSDFYISPEVRYVFRAVEEFGGTQTTFSGLGFGVSIGKEWKSGSNLNLGLALSYTSDTLEGIQIGPPGEDYKGEGSLTYYGIGLTLTFD